jgi:hypothetical protein
VKTVRVLMLALMVASCLPASGATPAQTMIAAPAPRLMESGPASPFVAREGTRPSPKRASGKTRTVLLVAMGVLGAVIVVMLLSSGEHTQTPDN